MPAPYRWPSEPGESKQRDSSDWLDGVALPGLQEVSACRPLVLLSLVVFGRSLSGAAPFLVFDREQTTPQHH
jgi:hypothetical protein